MSGLRLLLAAAALPVLGAGAAFHPSVRALGGLARAAAALALGAIAMTLTGLALTAARIPWTPALLAAPPLLASLVLGRLWARRPAPAPAPRAGVSAFGAAAVAVCLLALLVLSWALVSAGATSVDYLFFWGVKAARFAARRGVDVDLLRSPFFGHAVPDYPPLVPILQAFGALAAGSMPWRTILLGTAVWIAAAVPLVAALLRRSLSTRRASAVAAFWTAALAASVAYSLSGGNAEAPLVFFESIAVAALLTEDGDGNESRFLPALMLAGAALTKVEGLVGAACVAGGAGLRDVLARRPGAIRRTVALAAPACLAVGAWFAFQALEGLRVGYRTHGGLLDLSTDFLPSVIRSGFSAMNAGTYGLSWTIPLAFLLLAARRRGLRPLLPAITLTVGLLAFLVYDYLHDADDPAMRISWTAPRVTQPALSALILAAGIASLASDSRGEINGREKRFSRP